MQFDFKMGDKSLKLSKEQLVSSAGFFWKKIYMLVFAVFLVCMIVLAGWVWKKSLSGEVWSDQQKQEYLNMQNKGVVFNEDAFKKALSDVEMRKQSVTDNSHEIKDVFKAY